MMIIRVLIIKMSAKLIKVAYQIRPMMMMPLQLRTRIKIKIRSRKNQIINWVTQANPKQQLLMWYQSKRVCARISNLYKKIQTFHHQLMTFIDAKCKLVHHFQLLICSNRISRPYYLVAISKILITRLRNKILKALKNKVITILTWILISEINKLPH